MNHKQILSALAAEKLVGALEHDLARLTNWEMLSPKGTIVPHENIQRAVLRKLLARWKCALDAPGGDVHPDYKLKVNIALAVLLHKYGFVDEAIGTTAVEAIDVLNRQVALSDHFYKNAAPIKALIRSAPQPLRKRPACPENFTLWRTGDAFSYRLDDSIYAFYVHSVSFGNEAPLIEFYDLKLDRRPAVSDLSATPARGGQYNDGVKRIEKYWLYGMIHYPDLANQFHWVANIPNAAPSQKHLAPAVAQGAVTDLFRLQDVIRRQFPS